MNTVWVFTTLILSGTGDANLQMTTAPSARACWESVEEMQIVAERVIEKGVVVKATCVPLEKLADVVMVIDGRKIAMEAR